VANGIGKPLRHRPRHTGGRLHDNTNRRRRIIWKLHGRWQPRLRQFKENNKQLHFGRYLGIFEAVTSRIKRRNDNNSYATFCHSPI